MDALELDPDGYAGSYKLIGGRPSLDLVNTVSWAGTSREHDWLAVPANVAHWLAAAGLPCAGVAAADLSAVLAIRDVIGAVLRPLAHGEHPSAAHVARFTELLRDALPRRRIAPDDLGWTWDAPVRAAHCFAPVVLDAAELLAEADHARVRHCPECGWLFEDGSRNNRRRWCAMADCGSRAKARAYYRRRQQSPR